MNRILEFFSIMAWLWMSAGWGALMSVSLQYHDPLGIIASIALYAAAVKFPFEDGQFIFKRSGDLPAS